MSTLGDNGKNTPKRATPIAVSCQLQDCYFFERFTDPELGRALCSHPEKDRYMSAGRCPLYRLDWLRQLSKANQSR